MGGTGDGKQLGQTLYHGKNENVEQVEQGHVDD
jgi:hypothetical protein